jgi:hypothetical protein
MLPSYDWDEPYIDAILETDRSKLTVRIYAAQAAIDRLTASTPLFQRPQSREPLGFETESFALAS